MQSCICNSEKKTHYITGLLVSVFCVSEVTIPLILCASQLSMTTDTGLGKDEEEEEDDTMQNTVVLFSSTDKFVLLQVSGLRYPR